MNTAIQKARQTQLEAWPVVLGLLLDVASSDTVCSIIGASGLEVDWTLSKVESFSHLTRNRAYRPKIEAAYRALDVGDRTLVRSVIAAELAHRYPTKIEAIRNALARVGWTLKMTSDNLATTSQDATIMVRNKELQKLLLTQVRDGQEPPELRKYPQAEQVYNSALLINDGLVEGQAIQNGNGHYVSTVMLQLTSAGHDFLENSARAGEGALVSGLPPELTESMKGFREDHPNPADCGFIMMRFGTTKAHAEILDSIRGALATHGLTALRADDKAYHDDLFWNILTYVHGCGFGVAIFERIEQEDFNPNISLEVGYTLALRKPVLLLKDKTLKNLNTDLVGRLYRTFDPQSISASMSPEIQRWLKDKNLIA